MSITFDRPPEQSLDALEQGLAAVHIPESNAPHPLLKFPIGDKPEPRMAHEIYALQLDRLAEGTEKLEEEKPLAWRYIVAGTGAESTSADVEIQGQGKHTFSELGRNRVAHGMLAEYDQASGDPTLAHGSFVVRLLRVPALAFSALWLHKAPGKSCDNDVFIPLKGFSSCLTPGKHYRKDDLLRELQGKARKKSAMITDTSS
jgi:hypothetical protein